MTWEANRDKVLNGLDDLSKRVGKLETAMTEAKQAASDNAAHVNAKLDAQTTAISRMTNWQTLVIAAIQAFITGLVYMLVKHP